MANTENVTLILNAAGGSIFAATADPISAPTLHLRAAGQIGDLESPIVVATPNLFTQSLGEQHLAADGATPPVIRQAVSTGGTIFLDPHPNSRASLFTLDGMMTRAEVMGGVELQGQGEVDGDLTIRSGATLDPGLADETAGTIQIKGFLTLQRDSQIFFDVNPPYLQAGRDYDHLIADGGVDLGGATLKMRGGAALQLTINDLSLIEVGGSSLAQGNFLLGGDSAVVERIGPIDTIRIGLTFKGKLFFDGGDGNDIVIRELSLTPPVQPSNYRPIAPRMLQLIRTDRFAPEPPLVNQIQPVVEPPLIEEDVENVQVRKIEVRLVLPLDDQGNVSEEKVLELEAAWIKNLQAVFRRLPDDRYRIYLILEGGEARRVMDVIVRDGRPFEPEEARPAFSPSANPPLVKPAVPAAPVPAAEGSGDRAASRCLAELTASMRRPRDHCWKKLPKRPPSPAARPRDCSWGPRRLRPAWLPPAAGRMAGKRKSTGRRRKSPPGPEWPAAVGGGSARPHHDTVRRLTAPSQGLCHASVSVLQRRSGGRQHAPSRRALPAVWRHPRLDADRRHAAAGNRRGRR